MEIKKMKGILLLLGLAVAGLSSSFAQGTQNGLRAPAYPLITIDPNMSAWSPVDNLYEGAVTHWSDNRPLPLIGVIKVGKTYYRFLGTEETELLSLVSNGEDKPWAAKYTTKQPGGDWTAPNYDDKNWLAGEGAFGTFENEPLSKTNWTTDRIWVRREIVLNEQVANRDVFLEYAHDDDAEFYVNGVKVVSTGQATGKNRKIKLNERALKSLKKGKNVLAAYCHNGGGNGFLDMGLQIERADKKYFMTEAKQLSADVQPMRTNYLFQCGDAQLKVSFTAPLFLDDLMLLARPINYLSYEVTSPKTQDVELYFEAAPNWALNLPSQESVSEHFESNGLVYVKTGSVAQKLLGRKGDHVRNDWGYFYMAGEKSATQALVGSPSAIRASFTGGKAQDNASGRQLALIQKGRVSGKLSGKIAIGYDDIYAIQYFGQNLRPYWNKTGQENIEGQFERAFEEYGAIMKRVDEFDTGFMQKYARFGREYAELCALAYRQSIAAHKLVEAPNGDLLLLSKENDSNGSIGTVDVTYPSAPLFLYYNPELAKGLLNFIFYYSESGKWQKPFAAHDVGTYPIANGQTYGGDMPVEESGNMLILTYAIARAEGDAAYAQQHWNVLTTWADYLVEKGLDPENQLCTDDFAGHFAHNANLSIKAILGIASYGYLAKMLGRDQVADRYLAIAKEMGQQWEKMANDGDHYRLTFDKPGTWSQKYNLVWDKLLGMNVFDDQIRKKEVAYYLTKQNKYGLPLDSRETYTKSDWVLWTAVLADDLPSFQSFVKPIHAFMDETVHRVPMSDWIFTDKPDRRGFKARSVVGGYFMKMLEEKYGSQ
ncbi:L-glutaminase [Sphingobacterium allocomposti]|uniref:L-glutaminase n=1 Tax=Sphingobacterium allocomposti TaxID=415956 RepID=A0A5S5DUS9_9SPHI|nr:glutaminase family protein [Sphingobacterium composti Yoo et al. 2007 non Ten et al. 2007]TYP98369.1 L-glutaminase [Sphingobacterium composti Yoo et al. 2007 non Ten et al. 2007]